MLKQRELGSERNSAARPSTAREPESRYAPGLEGVVAAQTRLSDVDGQAGRLTIAGFPLEEIAGRASFEEMVYLLWEDRLPNVEQLEEFRQLLARERDLSPATLELLRAAAESRLPAMDALRMAAGCLNLVTTRRVGDWRREGAVLLGQIPSMITAYWHLFHGAKPVAPRADLSHAANYLYMLRGEPPLEAQTRALETYLNTVVDHGLNASTFTARVITSTGSDTVAAIVGAIGALNGPLHGGAPGPALDMVFEIGEADRAQAYLRAKLDRKERLMGFGHRVYRVRDPRADVLARAAESLYREAGDMTLYNLAKEVEQTALALLKEYQPGRDLQTNVEFYTALLLHGLGLPVDLFTPTFTMGRAAGWIAHCAEQRAHNRLIRPQSEYIGSMDRRWQPLDER
ncbi:MAG: citrate synthase, partial [Rudaea sp.]